MTGKELRLSDQPLPKDLLCVCCKPLLYFFKGPLTSFPHFCPLSWEDGFDAHRECATDWPVIGCMHFVPPVLQLLNPTWPSIEDSITPRRRSFFFARVVIVRSDIVLVRRSKGNRPLDEGSESKAWVPLPGQIQLIPFQEFAQVIGLHGVDDGISRHGVDAIIEIAAEYTYLVVQDQGAIASTDIRVSPKPWIPLCRK